MKAMLAQKDAEKFSAGLSARVSEYFHLIVAGSILWEIF